MILIRQSLDDQNITILRGTVEIISYNILSHQRCLCVKSQKIHSPATIDTFVRPDILGDWKNLADPGYALNVP